MFSLAIKSRFTDILKIYLNLKIGYFTLGETGQPFYCTAYRI